MGLRISDVSTLEWKPFENDEFLLNTKKENVVAHIYISTEFREMLTKYLKTIDPKNKYLFQSVKSEHLTVKHIDYMLHAIVKRAGLPNNTSRALGEEKMLKSLVIMPNEHMDVGDVLQIARSTAKRKEHTDANIPILSILFDPVCKVYVALYEWCSEPQDVERKEVR